MHGGTSANSIVDKVTQAAKLAIENQDEYPQFSIETVLFFDEANTTEAIGTIKEIMCDHTIQGKPLRHLNRLKLIAACNPYRKCVSTSQIFPIVHLNNFVLDLLCDFC